MQVGLVAKTVEAFKTLEGALPGQDNLFQSLCHKDLRGVCLEASFGFYKHFMLEVFESAAVTCSYPAKSFNELFPLDIFSGNRLSLIPDEALLED